MASKAKYILNSSLLPFCTWFGLLPLFFLIKDEVDLWVSFGEPISAKVLTLEGLSKHTGLFSFFRKHTGCAICRLIFSVHPVVLLKLVAKTQNRSRVLVKSSIIRYDQVHTDIAKKCETANVVKLLIKMSRFLAMTVFHLSTIPKLGKYNFDSMYT